MYDSQSLSHTTWEAELEKTVAWYEATARRGGQLWMRLVPITTKSGKRELH